MALSCPESPSHHAQCRLYWYIAQRNRKICPAEAEIASAVSSVDYGVYRRAPVPRADFHYYHTVGMYERAGIEAIEYQSSSPALAARKGYVVVKRKLGRTDKRITMS